MCHNNICWQVCGRKVSISVQPFHSPVHPHNKSGLGQHVAFGGGGGAFGGCPIGPQATQAQRTQGEQEEKRFFWQHVIHSFSISQFLGTLARTESACKIPLKKIIGKPKKLPNRGEEAFKRRKHAYPFNLMLCRAMRSPFPRPMRGHVHKVD